MKISKAVQVGCFTILIGLFSENLIITFLFLFVAQELDRNWRAGAANLKEVKLNDFTFDLYKEQEFIKDMIAMNEKFVVIGCRIGFIQMCNRRSMITEKV